MTDMARERPISSKAKHLNDILTGLPTRKAAKAAAEHGLPTYLYLYSYIRPSERGKVPGAVHTDGSGTPSSVP